MRKLTLLLLTAALLAPASLLAQPADLPAGGDAAPAPAPKPADPAPAPAPAPDPAPAPAADPAPAAKKSDAPVVGGTDMSAYGVSEGDVPPGGTIDWAKRRRIRVIQKRAILKQGRHGLSLYGGVVPNDDFFAYVAGGLGYSYYFSEDLALDITAAYTQDAKTALEGSLTADRLTGQGPGLDVRLPETLVGYSAASVTWYLLHGKLGFFQTQLTEFDAGFNFGIGGNMTFVQGKSAADQAYTIKPNGNIGLTMLFYLGERWAMRVDYKQFFYPKDGGGVSFPISTTFGLSWFTAPLD